MASEVRKLLDLSGEDGCSYEVLEHTDAAKLNAARRAIEEHIGYFDSGVPKTVAWLATQACASTMREHTTHPEDGCFCEEKGWWCELGDSEPHLFYSFEWSDIYNKADEMAHAEDDPED